MKSNLRAFIRLSFFFYKFFEQQKFYYKILTGNYYKIINLRFSKCGKPISCAIQEPYFSLRGPAKAPTPASAEGASFPAKDYNATHSFLLVKILNILTRGFGARWCRSFRWTPKGKVWLLDCTTKLVSRIWKNANYNNFIIVSSYNFIILFLLFKLLISFDI